MNTTKSIARPAPVAAMEVGGKYVCLAPWPVQVLLWLYSRPFVTKLALADLLAELSVLFEDAAKKLLAHDSTKGQRPADRAWVILHEFDPADSDPYDAVADAPIVRRALRFAVLLIAAVVLVAILLMGVL